MTISNLLGLQRLYPLYHIDDQQLWPTKYPLRSIIDSDNLLPHLYPLYHTGDQLPT